MKAPVKMVSLGWVSGSKKVAVRFRRVITSAAADGALLPMALLAITANARPAQPDGQFTTIGEAEPDAENPAGTETTV